MPELEVRIPIGPTPSMFNRVHLITHSIRSLGGRFKDAAVRVSVGADIQPYDLHEALPWSKKLDIHWSWVDRKVFNKWRGKANSNIAAMVDDRFFVPPTTDYVLMLDADVLAIKEFDFLFHQLAAPIQAVMAHTAPFQHISVCWKELLGPYWDREMHEVSGWGIMERDADRRYSPPYFNTGVVFMHRDALRPFLRTLHASCLDQAAENYNSYFIDQIAFTMMIVEGAVPYKVLPLRYNFPNQGEFDAHHKAELDDVRFIHFLRPNAIDREADFKSIGDIKALVARKDLQGSNEVLRKRVAELLPLMLDDLAPEIIQSDAKA